MSQPQTTPPLSQSGFSLIELLAVLVIIAILVSMAGPRLSGQLRLDRVAQAADHVRSDVSLTRMYAVREGRSTCIHYAAAHYDIRTSCGLATEAVVKTVNLGDDFPGVAVTSTLNPLRFDSRGMLINAASGTITTSGYGMTALLKVSPIGRVFRDH